VNKLSSSLAFVIATRLVPLDDAAPIARLLTGMRAIQETSPFARLRTLKTPTESQVARWGKRDAYKKAARCKDGRHSRRI
jgi:hypothetical protein